MVRPMILSSMTSLPWRPKVWYAVIREIITIYKINSLFKNPLFCPKRERKGERRAFV
jgi:hypothetical protein